MDASYIQELFKRFESIMQTIGGVECWSARDLQTILGYKEWRNFLGVIEKARIACQSVEENDLDHFVGINKMVTLGSGSEREIEDFILTRYAAYLVAQNGDPAKPEIAFAMTYFAVQTRKQEVIAKRLMNIDRIKAREKLTETEKNLSGILYQRGIDNTGFALIRSKGDEALFRFTTQDMKRKLSVPDGRALADFLPTVTIKAKDLAAEMTNVNVIDNDIRGMKPISEEHIENNKAVRKALAERGIQPETLPPAEDLQKVKRKLESEDKKVLRDVKKLQKITKK